MGIIRINRGAPRRSYKRGKVFPSKLVRSHGVFHFRLVDVICRASAVCGVVPASVRHFCDSKFYERHKSRQRTPHRHRTTRLHASFFPPVSHRSTTSGKQRNLATGKNIREQVIAKPRLHPNSKTKTKKERVLDEPCNLPC